MSDRRRLAVVLVALSLVATACGLRVDHATRTRAADAALGMGGGTGVAAGQGGGGAASSASGAGAQGAGAAAGGTQPGSGPSGPSVGAGSSGGAAGPGGAGTGGVQATAPAGGNGGATDVGVTATSITVGNVADLSGPVPGLFQAAPYGVEAYFAYVNSQGGVFGRQLRVVSLDSQTDCTANKTAHLNLINKVFAFVGSFSLFDDCGTDVLKQHPTVADLSYALGLKTKANNVNNFPPEPAPPGYQSGMFCYWAHKYGDAVKHVGSIYPNIPSAAINQKMFEKAANTCGWQWVADYSTPAAQTNFQAEIRRMQLAGVKLVYINAENAQNAAEIKNEAEQQGWHPIWVMPIGYASDFVDRIGGAQKAEGVTGAVVYSLFFNQDDARTIPEVALFQKWMKRTHPNAAIELYAMYSWAAAKMFVQVLKDVGPDLTRKKFMAAVKKVHSYDAGGMLPPGDPVSKKPANCYVVWTIHNGQYVREATPPGKFRCDGTFVRY